MPNSKRVAVREEESRRRSQETEATLIVLNLLKQKLVRQTKRLEDATSVLEDRLEGALLERGN